MPSYFAYGSNLDDAQMMRRCPDARFVAVGSLPDFQLRFTVYSQGWGAGTADAVECPGDRVWGLVYELSENDLDTLDRFEGCPHQYNRFKAQIEAATGTVPAWVYTATHKESFVPPSRRYVDIIKAAAIRHRFPPEYLQMLCGVSVVDT